MPRFKVRDDEKEEIVEFWLEEQNDGSIQLLAEAGGGPWQIASITNEGKLHRATKVGLPFIALTDGARIMLDE